MKLHFDIAKKEKILRELLLSLIFFYRMTTYWRFFTPAYFFKLASKQSALSNYVLTVADKDRYQGLFNVRIVVSIVQCMCCNEKSTHLSKKGNLTSKGLFSQTLTIRLEWKMFYLPMRSCWSNTIDHSTKASSERLGQESIQNGVDTGVTIGE